MKILQIFNQYLEYGGEEGSVSRIAQQLRSEHTIRTYTYSTQELLNSPLGKLSMPYKMQYNARVIRDLRGLQEDEQFDFWQIHNVFPAMSVAVYELAAELGVPVIQFLHNYRFGCADATYFRGGERCFDCSPSNFFPAIQHRCWRSSFPATISMVATLKRFWLRGGKESIKAFIAISESQKQRHVKMGIAAEHIHVLHHSLDAGLEYNKPPQNGDVLFIGRLTEEKGLELLLRAWKEVAETKRILRIIGSGPLEEDLHELCRAEQIGNVKFMGFVDKSQHDAFYKKSAFVVAPSVWEEPFGMVVLEAWKHYRPVLTTNIGSFPDLIDNKKNGWLAPTDRCGFAAVLEKALSSPAYNEMGVNGHFKLEQQFNTKVWLNKWKSIVESVPH
ncbi:glycosyltransferase family 4 protein [Rubritalea spongiae]|uniref:Glycosyltransferase family 4 protein n=1 Tax=Rubritalea spongiae TaxID=430797 RepID=A0ABW5E3G6_9BACT